MEEQEMNLTRRLVLAGIGAATVIGGASGGAAASAPNSLPRTRVQGRHIYAVSDYDDEAYLLEPFEEYDADVRSFFTSGTYQTYQEPGATRVFFIEAPTGAYPYLVILHGADTSAEGGKASVSLSGGMGLVTTHNYTGNEDGGTYLYGGGDVAGSVHEIFIDLEGEMSGFSSYLNVNDRATGDGAVPPGDGITKLQFLSNKSTGRSPKVFDVEYDDDYNDLEGSVLAIPFEHR
jgi:hypothetical protein